MNDTLLKYKKLSEEILKLDLSVDENLEKLEGMLDARDELLDEIEALGIAESEIREYAGVIFDLDAGIKDKLLSAMSSIEEELEDIKAAKRDKAKTKAALKKYEGEKEDVNSVFFDKNT